MTHNVLISDCINFVIKKKIGRAQLLHDWFAIQKNTMHKAFDATEVSSGWWMQFVSMQNVEIFWGVQYNFLLNKNMSIIIKIFTAKCQLFGIRKKHNELTLLAKKQTHNNLWQTINKK
jgi:hypothetical protein